MCKLDSTDIKLRALAYIYEVKEKAQDLVCKDSVDDDIVLIEELKSLFESDKVKKTISYLDRNFPEIGKDFKSFINETMSYYNPF